MEITPKDTERINKTMEILRDIRMKGEKPTVCLLKMKRNEKVAEFHEVVADWFINIPGGLNFRKAIEEGQFPENRLLAVIISGNHKKMLGIDRDVFYPESFGLVSSQSYFCIGLSKEEVFSTMRKRFQQKIENLDKRAESIKRAKENLLSCLSALDKKSKV